MNPRTRRRLVWAIITATLGSFVALDLLYLLAP
ncbi:MAG: hypothetical protein KatS3mg077_3210 [Candidatus Binatia bacterium]|nr:MAG: hypothetical protein KatS3mg077_3210 [Candidatus Binatia bacterium]